ncbi:DUF2267 domain-containing protein [Microvirga thermotolerans]|uniref:DUF2267 domain-containing protein n=1 Tax=Microvirga thermotolerans TaxID=2651334 RepID=A0A5P9JUC8_9HYPH|nr:DUF2267 domain-containing protein [Microvirga thermotolerans]QFU15769.1 DUF2267 domain-containing protein [Microvirga thermotolerans]
MTVPMEYRHASEAFERFLADARDEAGLGTRNQAYTMVQAVLLVFRRRLTLPEGIRFANALSPVLRALFVDGWDPCEPTQPFIDRDLLTREVQALRAHHNFAPDTAIRDVAAALRRHVDPKSFDEALRALPAEAAAFWRL